MPIHLAPRLPTEARQAEIVAAAQPKRDYYYQSRLGNRLFDLDLGPATLAL